MKKSEDYIKPVLNIVLLQGKLSNEDELIDILFKKYDGEIVFSQEEAESILQTLKSVQQRAFERKRKLSNIKLINTLGEYIQLWQDEMEFDDSKLSKSTNVPVQEIHNIKKNLISPIHVSIQKIARLIEELKLKIEEAKMLIEKTYTIHNLEFSGKTVLSRFDDKNLEIQGKSMRSATEELLMKAHKKKPLLEQSDNDLQKYLNDLEKELRKNK